MDASTCNPASPRSPAAVLSSGPACAWVIRSSLTRQGRQVTCLQIASERLVLTRLGSTDQLFRAADRTRFLVCHRTASLQPCMTRGAGWRFEATRTALGEVRTAWEVAPRLVDGYRCARLRVWNEDAHLSVAGEAWVMDHPEIGATALGLERMCTTPLQPLGLPLPANSLVVRSNFFLRAQHLLDRHSSRLTWVRAAPWQAIDLLARVAAYPLQTRLPGKAAPGG
jgi:hypothetical protein